MRPDGARKKKLVVAFHFQLSKPSGWNCDTCRKAGLELKRRCGWLTLPPPENNRPIWTRQGAFTLSCPKSELSMDSLTQIEAYCVAKLTGVPPAEPVTAREVDAFLILDRLVRQERESQNKRPRC